MATIICKWMFICMYVCFFTELENKWEVKIYILGVQYSKELSVLFLKNQ